MASKNYKFCISFLVALLLVTCVVDAEASHDDWNNGDYDYDNKLNWLSPWEVKELPPEPRKNFFRDLRSCLKTLTHQCNKRLYDYVYMKQEIHKPCCRKVFKMDMGCVESLAWVLTAANPWHKARLVDERLADALSRCSHVLTNEGEFKYRACNHTNTKKLDGKRLELAANCA